MILLKVNFMKFPQKVTMITTKVKV